MVNHGYGKSVAFWEWSFITRGWRFSGEKLPWLYTEQFNPPYILLYKNLMVIIKAFVRPWLKKNISSQQV